MIIFNRSLVLDNGVANFNLVIYICVGVLLKRSILIVQAEIFLGEICCINRGQALMLEPILLSTLLHFLILDIVLDFIHFSLFKLCDLLDILRCKRSILWILGLFLDRANPIKHLKVEMV